MAKTESPLTAYAYETSRVLGKCGCLLVSGDMEKANVMTIGWGLIGMLWGRPVFMVAVRPSRHTFGFMERSGEFTVNVPGKGMEKTAAYCGSVSGRDADKFKECGLTVVKGGKVGAPVIEECPISYECRVIYKERIVPEKVPKGDMERWYPKGDFHTVYFGEILSTTADKDAAGELPKWIESSLIEDG
jgi:flavin reductase (DIM6/NTAB) family NADH-FMN oxidoreductase RutF